MRPWFSTLFAHFDAPTNPLYQAKERLQAAGETVMDLVSGNVHAQGLLFPQAALEEVWIQAARRSAHYAPHPLGQRAAREALAGWYTAQGLPLSPEQILLTPGTSLSYWYAFRALADAGEEILCPQPNYPLLESLAALSGVRLTSYRLEAAERWRIDFDSMEAALTPRTRAVVLVSPHNPTGAVANPEEVRTLAAFARRHDLPIISDEVFSPFVFREGLFPRPASEDAPLVITMNGFSKMLALPGVKIGWMALSGEAEKVRRLRRLLEMMSDTFLPVNEVAQAAIPGLLERSAPFIDTYRQAVAERMRRTVSLLENGPALRVLAPEGGFYVSVGLPKNTDEEALALALLEQEKILVHPGFFYDFAQPFLVTSGISRLEELEEAVPRLARRVSLFCGGAS